MILVNYETYKPVRVCGLTLFAVLRS